MRFFNDKKSFKQTFRQNEKNRKRKGEAVNAEKSAMKAVIAGYRKLYEKRHFIFLPFEEI